MREGIGAVIIAIAVGVFGPSEVRGDEATTQGSQPQDQQPLPVDESPWSFRLTSYVWFAGMSGDVGVAGRVADIDVTFSEIFDAIDWFPPPVMLAGEVRYDRFAFLTDFIYMGLESSADSPGPLPLSAEVDMTEVVWTFVGSYRVIQDDPLTLDLLAGGRLWYLDSEVTITGPQNVLRGSGSKLWVDPIIGIAGRVDLGDGFALQAEADVGGFGVAADLDWQVVGALAYQVNDSIALEAGYRYLAVDFEDGGFLLDVAMHGPIIGGSIRF